MPRIPRSQTPPREKPRREVRNVNQALPTHVTFWDVIPTEYERYSSWEMDRKADSREMYF